MVATINIALLLTSTIGSVLAAPALLERGKTFSIAAIHNDKYVRNGTAAMLKAYAKYGLHSLRPNSVLQKRQDGSVGATPVTQDIEYLCPVSIGGQTLNLDLDTGSSDLWVFSTLLPSEDLKGHNVYNSSKSQTYHELSGYTWNITYGDGSSASGSVGTDTVVIGETTVEHQAIELASEISSTFVTDSSDGIIGLAFNKINTIKPKRQSTFFDNAKKSLDSPLFAAYLPYNATGAYDFGATNSSLFSGKIEFAPVSNLNGFWEFASESYMVGNKKFDASKVYGIADTGTTLILMQDSQVTQYYSSVSGAYIDDSAGGYVFPCDSHLPTISFLIGPSVYATIPANLLSFASDGKTCFGSLQSVGDFPKNIYGDIFFNAYYGVFDMSVPQFGFAPST